MFLQSAMEILHREPLFPAPLASEPSAVEPVRRHARPVPVPSPVRPCASAFAQAPEPPKPYHELFEACWRGSVDDIRLMFLDVATQQCIHSTNPAGDTALHVAAENGHAGVCEVLLEYGGLVDARNNFGVTPLHRAAQHGSASTVRTLLQHGADKDAQNEAQMTPLMIAVTQGNYGAVSELLEARAKKDLLDESGYPALYFACAADNIELVGLLLSHQANPNAGLTNEHRPAYGAVINSKERVLSTLCALGADINIVVGPRPEPLLTYAMYEHLTEVALLLMRAGARQEMMDLSAAEAAAAFDNQVCAELFKAQAAPEEQAAREAIMSQRIDLLYSEFRYRRSCAVVALGLSDPQSTLHKYFSSRPTFDVNTLGLVFSYVSGKEHNVDYRLRSKRGKLQRARIAQAPAQPQPAVESNRPLKRTRLRGKHEADEDDEDDDDDDGTQLDTSWSSVASEDMEHVV